MTNHSEWLETNDNNQMVLCSVNMVKVLYRKVMSRGLGSGMHCAKRMSGNQRVMHLSHSHSFIWRNACREPRPHDITFLYNTLNMAGEVRLPNSCPVYTIFVTGSATCGRPFSWSKISFSWRLAYSSRFFWMLDAVSSIDVYSKQLWSVHPVSASRGIPYLIDPSKYTASPFEHEYCILALTDLVHLAVFMLFVVCPWLSAALFFKLKQKIKASCTCYFFGSKRNVFDVIKNVMCRNEFTLKYWMM